MTTSLNVITIVPAGGDVAGKTVFHAPANSQAARALWVFLIENLQAGFTVELSDGVHRLRRPSGEPLPADVYSDLMEPKRRVFNVEYQVISEE